jgi:hypothetical protein
LKTGKLIEAFLFEVDFSFENCSLSVPPTVGLMLFPFVSLVVVFVFVFVFGNIIVVVDGLMVVDVFVRVTHLKGYINNITYLNLNL